MIGTHSKEGLLGELKLTCSDEELAKVEKEIESKVAQYKGKYKEFPQVQICRDIVYYPKDGSFSFLEKDHKEAT